jgi:arylsulfatase A-like enzyme
MSRSSLTLVAGLALLAAVASTALVASTHERKARLAPAGATRPNIVLVVTDDQRWDTLWAMPVVVEALVEHGVTFSNSFVVNPECCPSRASLLTGKYSHSTGVYTNTGPYGGFAAFRDSRTIATALNAAGYSTGLFGKYLNGYGAAGEPAPYVPPGWDSWSAFYGGNDYYGYRLADRRRVVRYDDDPADYSTSVLAHKAVAFVRRVREPFFLELAPFAPHAPATAPPGRDRAFEGFLWWKPESFDERDLSDKPAYIRSLGNLTPGQIRFAVRFRRMQLAASLGVDNAMYTVLRALQQRHVLGRTVIVFTSDNGMAWGSHGLTARGKWVPYEEAIRVPLVIRYDPVTHERPRQDDRLALNIDLAPTLAALAGVELPGADGRSLLPLLRQPARLPTWRRDFVVEHLAGPNQLGVPTYCAARSERYKYVVYQTGEVELYDLYRDPNELRNLADRSSLRAVATRMHARLDALCKPRPPGFTALSDR